MFKLSEMFGQSLLLDGELSKTSEFGRTLDRHLLKLAPLVSTSDVLAVLLAF